MEQKTPQPVWRKEAKRKRRKRKKRIQRTQMLIAYAVRAATVLVLAIMIFLMLCGCLYIRDFFRRSKDASQNSGFGLESLSYADELSLKGASPYTVILDAGHGGNDSGTIEQSASEKDINLSVVLKMKQLLESKNIQVILTRDQDIFMELEERAQAAREQKADLFLSIHCNYYEKDSSIRGLECYYNKDSAEGKYFAEKLMESMEEAGAIPLRNAKPAEYFVLKNVSIPSVLVETGYLSNPRERQDLTSQEYQDKLAAELVEGVIKGLEAI